MPLGASCSTVGNRRFGGRDFFVARFATNFFDFAAGFDLRAGTGLRAGFAARAIFFLTEGFAAFFAFFFFAVFLRVFLPNNMLATDFSSAARRAITFLSFFAMAVPGRNDANSFT